MGRAVGPGVEAENEAQEQMKNPEFTVLVKLGRGGASRTMWTCDFSAEYVKINAEYRS